jgi:prolyl oligopeptidase
MRLSLAVVSVPALSLALGLVAAGVAACASTTEKETIAPVTTKAAERADAASKPENPGERKMKLSYPTPRKGDVVDVYFGTEVADPFRALEDPDAEETKAWVEAENKVTFGWLDRVPGRQALKERLTELWNYERYSPPFIEGRGADKRTFWFKNDGLQNQAVLWVQDAPGKGGAPEPRVLLDPNALSADGTIALSSLAISDDGKRMAYSLAKGGSDWVEWHVKEVATGKDLPDLVKWSKFSGASWAKDGSGFFYARYPEPKAGDDYEEANYFHKVYFHRIGDPQEKDTLVVEDKDHKTWGFDASVTEDGSYLIIHVWDGTDRRNRVWFQDLKKKGAPIQKLFDDFDASYGVIGNVGSTLYVQTDLEAPRRRVVAVDLKSWKSGARPKLIEVIPQHEKDKIESASMIGGGFLVRWLQNAHDIVTFHDIKGKKTQEIPLPTIGTTGGFTGKQKDTETYYSFTSFTYPTVIYKLDLTTGVSTLFRQPTVKFNPSEFETKQVFYPGRDGTQIPMFIVHKKGIAYDGQNPTYLYAYGGFNISLTPAFSTALIAWLEKGGVYAQPSLRGGGEFGEDWHQAGMLERKQTVFDDFAAAAEHLIATKITSTPRLGIGGGSNGGLLVGASITQRPELFGAAVAMVGVMDMLRFHKFTIGHAWVSEYGSSDDEKMFKVLKGYSPLHNLKPRRYPATLVTTADHDDRVVPAHSFKFAAALQEAQQGPEPVLIRVDVKAGHGAGKPTSKLIDEAADRWSFLRAALGVEELRPQ